MDDDRQPADVGLKSATVIVRNPPFLGKGEPMRQALGDDYLDRLETAYPQVPKSADFVMYWWDRAARRVQAGETERFGLITTNSITQTFNRRVVERHLGSFQAKPGTNSVAPLALMFAVPDHPWVDRGAAVRVAMTAGASSARMDARAGVLATAVEETPTEDGYADVTLAHHEGEIHADLTVGADVTQAEPLEANDGLSSFGMMLSGRGFVLSAGESEPLREHDTEGAVIRPLLNGRDLTKPARDRYVVDFYGLTAEDARERHPRAYERLLREVKPERETKRDKAFRENWWLFGRTRPALRQSLVGLDRYIATPETAKHRLFQFLDASIAPEHKIIAIALDDAYYLGVPVQQGARVLGGRGRRKSRCRQRLRLQHDALFQALPIPGRHRRAGPRDQDARGRDPAPPPRPPARAPQAGAYRPVQRRREGPPGPEPGQQGGACGPARAGPLVSRDARRPRPRRVPGLRLGRPRPPAARARGRGADAAGGTQRRASR